NSKIQCCDQWSQGDRGIHPLGMRRRCESRETDPVASPSLCLKPLATAGRSKEVMRLWEMDNGYSCLFLPDAPDSPIRPRGQTCGLFFRSARLLWPPEAPAEVL